MKKEFDFDSVGKKTPYRVPEGFFEEMQNNVIQRTAEKEKKHFSLRRIVKVSLAAAAVALGAWMLPDIMLPEEDEMLNGDMLVANTNWIENMSDEDLAYMESIYECDIFMY